MIKFSSVATDGRVMFTLGLSQDNCSQLLRRHPLHVNSAVVGITPAFEVGLLAGPDEHDIIGQITATGISVPAGGVEPGTVTVRVTELRDGRTRHVLLLGITAARLDRMLQHGDGLIAPATFATADGRKPADDGTGPVVLVCAGRDNNDVARRLVNIGMLPAAALDRDNNVAAGEPEQLVDFSRPAPGS